MPNKRRGHGEGTVTKRSDGRWMARVTLADGSRKSFYGRSEAEAIGKKTEALSKLGMGLPLSDERLTVEKWLARWVSSAKHRVRPQTHHRYKEIVDYHLNPRLGRIRLHRLKPSDVETMMQLGLDAGQSPRSVAHHRAVLRTALNAAIKDGMITRNAASLADPPHVPEPERDVITPARAQAIFDAVRGDRLEALYVLLLASGLRLGEALGLRWTDIDMDAGSLRVQRTLQRVDGEWTFPEPKTHRSRRLVPIHTQVVQVVKDHHVRQLKERLAIGSACWEGDKWGLVFTTELGGPISIGTAHHRFQKLLRKAGLPVIRTHDLRHGAASLWAAMGVPARAAMEFLGHSNISTTMNIYTAVAPEWGRELMDSVGDRLFANTTNR